MAFPSEGSSFSSSSSWPANDGMAHGTELTTLLDRGHESSKLGINMQGNRMWLWRLSPFHRCLITFWQASATRCCQNPDLTLECHLQLGHLWMGSNEMDPSGWCLNIVYLISFMHQMHCLCGLFFFMCYRNRCWWCSVTRTVSLRAVLVEEVRWSRPVVLKHSPYKVTC